MVGILAGALGSGIGQAAEATAKLGRDYIDDERKVDVYRQMSDVDVMKQDRIDELKKARDYEYKVKESDPNSELFQNKLAGSNLEARQSAINQIDKINTQGYLQSVEKEDYAKSSGERSVKSTAPGETESERNYKNAQTEKTITQNAVDKQVADLRREAADPNTSPERKKAIKETLEIVTGKDQDNYGTYQAPDGTVRKYNKKTGEDVQDAQAQSGPKEGDVAKSRSGKDMVYRNGKWEYK